MEFPWGGRGSVRPTNLRKCMMLDWWSPESYNIKIPSMGEVWIIFWNYTLVIIILCNINKWLIKNKLSVVFCWLRDERGGKRFPHTWLGVWPRVCGGSQVMWEDPSLTPSHPPTHAWSISRVGLSLCVFSFASLLKFECNFFHWNQLLMMYSFLLVFLDSVSSSWPVFVLLYLSFCVNKGQATCSAWHGSQLCVRNSSI